MYRGRIGTGIVWLIVVAFGYMMMTIPGLILHLFCIFSAASNPAADRREQVDNGERVRCAGCGRMGSDSTAARHAGKLWCPACYAEKFELG